MAHRDDWEARKRVLRAWARERRRAVTPDEARVAGERVAAAIDTWLERSRRRVGTALLYASLPGELDTAAIDGVLRARGALVAYPRVTGPGALALHLAAPAALSPSARGIREPPPTAPAVLPTALDLVVVPGLAFDEGGHRLGFGGGFYDRLLAPLPRATRIGACLAWQLVAEVPHAPHDERVDLVITDGDALPRATFARGPLDSKEETP